MAEAVSPVRTPSCKGTGPENEPSMRLHRPSSARSQDVRHVLTKTFGDLFTREAISVDTIKNLITTRDGDDEYHGRYVDSLQEVLSETEDKLSEICMLERHIMQAEAKALSADERHTHKATEGLQDDLGLPISSNHFRSCIDYELMKKHNLLTPDRYANYKPPKVPKPQPPPLPDYIKETENSVNASKGKKEKMEMLQQSRFLNKTENEKHVSPSNSKISQLNHTLDNEDTESVDYIKEGSEAGGLNEGIATFESHPRKSSSKSGKGSKRTWTEQLAVEAREQERAALEKLQNRTNYLKNPRHDVAQAQLLTSLTRPQAKEISIKQSPTEVTPIERVQVFLPTPSVITFTDYQVGQVYEATLDLKNISASLRPVRVLPTSTNFFTVGLGQFPGEQGLVASGMSAQFKVRFMPDSLGEYTDEIHIQSQAAQPLVVKIIAKRPPPVLTLQPIINIGECLVGGTKRGKFLIRNDGGNGTFCFISKDRWPVTNFKSSVNPASLDVAPFQIRPAIFDIGHKETTMIEVIYKPTSLGGSSHDVLMLCDNCHMKKFTITGKGQLAGVEFVAIDGGTSEKEVGELCDATAQKLIRFDDLNPFTYTQKTMILSNTTNVAMPFEWVITKPHITMEAGEGDDRVDVPVSRTVDLQTPFSIDPENGILDPSGIANFKITFAPPEVGRYHSVLHLVLPGIPQIASETEESTNRLGSIEKEMLKNVTALEFECKAECIPLQVLLQPLAIYVNGKSLHGTTVRRHFTFINNSVSAATFQWESPNSNNIIEVTPALGEVGPSMAADMEVSITGCEVGKMHEILLCHVKNLDEPLALHVDFEIKGPEIYIDEPDVNFGLVRFGTVATTTLTLHNDSQMPAVYEIRENLPANRTTEKSEFTFSPKKGEMRPLETRTVEVEFFPQSCKVVRSFYELIVGDGGLPRTVAVRADVQKPDVCLLSCKLNIPTLFINMESTQTVTLINKSLLSTQYTWGKPIGSHQRNVKLELKETGEIRPRESVEFNLKITATTMDEVADLILPCHIAGMDEPLLLSITAKVEGIQISYAVMDSSNPSRNLDESEADESCVDYGTVFVKSTAKKYLYIKNMTPIPTNYELSLKNFSSRPPTPPASKFKSQTCNRKALLQKTPNIADPHSKSKERALIELQQQLLKTDKGLAIVPTPSCGKLAPYEKLVVELALYSDMWGVYEDTLTCRITDMDPHHIPVKMNVVGIPLQFHMAAVTKDPTLRFGTHASNAKTITRTVRINNHGPVDTRIDWQMFNVVPGDKQLIDFVVSYGAAFPKKDSQGRTIDRSPSPPASPESRPPTELILNTPDSTPAPSGGISRASGDTNRPSTQASLITDAGSNAPLIQITLRPHEGHEAVKPFTVQPSQMVVPARDKGFINVTFDPESGDPMGEDCNSFILGYLNMETKDSAIENKVSRTSGYAMEPMKLSLAGCIEPALLSNEFMDDEGLRFRGVASDLMRDGVAHPKAYYCIGNGTKLSNLTEALLSFRIDVAHPFLFTRSIPAAGEDNFISLKPNGSSEIYLDFCISADQISLINEHREEREDMIGQRPIVVVRRESERQVHFTQTLKILFSSGAIQELPLHASLVIPSLVTNTSEIDFGTCLIGQRKQKTFLLRNRTKSASYWNSRRTFANQACQADTFIVSPTSGSLDAHIAHVTKSDVLVTVSFLARQDCFHRAQFTITGVLGEEPLTITATGSGSFDEKHCDLLDLVIDPAQSN